ncbi:hypothetical protein JZ751_020326 [Albula glossodonta]|uniref:Uncharacterized protein n=1 Tax=Albula glossodonta TaxID=121402 RepID=A0A8T2NL08_9TELE|nr:hypothetical protein JZ751_020326 [Albula glossodonta]
MAIPLVPGIRDHGNKVVPCCGAPFFANERGDGYVPFQMSICHTFSFRAEEESTEEIAKRKVTLEDGKKKIQRMGRVFADAHAGCRKPTPGLATLSANHNDLTCMPPVAG